jgi:hypothetical protein
VQVSTLLLHQVPDSLYVLIISGKIMLPPGEDGPTIEQEIEAGGQLGEVCVVP